MAANGLQFFIMHDVKDEYRWKLRSAQGETVDFSRRGHGHKGNCGQEVQHLRNDEYPGARVCDLSVNRSEN